MKVFINDKDSTKPRKVVEVEVIRETPRLFIVKLPDGNIISRKKSRDIVQETLSI